MNTTKVRLDITITIDVDALNAEYGDSKTKREAAEDAFWSAVNAVQQTAYPEGSSIIKEVKVNNHG